MVQVGKKRAIKFSEKELKQIEELHPNIAPAIDTMKEEVKDNEAD